MKPASASSSGGGDAGSDAMNYSMNESTSGAGASKKPEVDPSSHEQLKWMSLLMRPDRIGWTARVGRPDNFAPSGFWDTYAMETAPSAQLAKSRKLKPTPTMGATINNRVLEHSAALASSKSTSTLPPHSPHSPVMTATGQSVVSGKSPSKKVAKWEQKLMQATARRQEVEEKLSELEHKVAREYFKAGRIQVTNPSPLLEEMAPDERFRLYLIRETNNAVALEDERRRQLVRAERSKTGT